MKRRCLFLAAVLSVFWGGRMIFAEMQVRLFSPPEAYVGLYNLQALIEAEFNVAAVVTKSEP